MKYPFFLIHLHHKEEKYLYFDSINIKNESFTLQGLLNSYNRLIVRTKKDTYEKNRLLEPFY